MIIESNTIRFTANAFRKELTNQFDSSEIEQLLQITFEHYFSLGKADIILDGDKELSPLNIQKLKEVIQALKLNKPLAQIIGLWVFFGLTFKVNKHTLIPRPETEELVQLIIEENKGGQQLSILDIGTGSGCIAISLSKDMPNAELTAFDVSEAALKMAAENAQINEVPVSFKKVDILAPHTTNAKFDIIVSNPPYITHKEKELMHSNVLAYEPHLALFVENEAPLLFYENIADFAINHLTNQGKLYFEINEHYGLEVKEMLLHKKFKNVIIVKDMNEKNRIVHCNIDRL
jgi:release factor glutamine methyltransferase